MVFFIVFQLSERYTLLRSQKKHVHIMASLDIEGQRSAQNEIFAFFRGTDFSVPLYAHGYFSFAESSGTINKNQERKPCANVT